MKLRYSGPHDEVVIENGATCKRGKTVDVTGELAGRLLAQTDIWAKVAPRKRRTPKTSAKPAANTPNPDTTPEG